MSTPKDVVKRQLDASGTLILNVSSALSDEEFFHEPKVGASLAWSLGHLAALQDWCVSNVVASEERLIDKSKREVFRGGRRITGEDRKAIPSRRELEALFRDTQTRAIAALEKFDLSRWDEATPTGCRFPTLGAVWEHLASHNFWHLGQMSACVPRLAGTTLTVNIPRHYSLPFEEGGDV